MSAKSRVGFAKSTKQTTSESMSTLDIEKPISISSKPASSTEPPPEPPTEPPDEIEPPTESEKAPALPIEEVVETSSQPNQKTHDVAPVIRFAPQRRTLQPLKPKTVPTPKKKTTVKARPKAKVVVKRKKAAAKKTGRSTRKR